MILTMTMIMTMAMTITMIMIMIMTMNMIMTTILIMTTTMIMTCGSYTLLYIIIIMFDNRSFFHRPVKETSIIIILIINIIL